MIQHSVVFTLKHQRGSPEEENFIEAIRILEDIPTVRNFRRLNQVSKKNKFSYGLSMDFESKEAYEKYNDHPIHREFVKTRWIPEVADFMEIDYTPF